MKPLALLTFCAIAHASFAQAVFNFPSGLGGTAVSPGFAVIEGSKVNVGPSNVYINQLGHETGFLTYGARSVAVWDVGTGAVIVQASVAATDPITSGYHYKSIPTTTLLAGRSYVIGALHQSGVAASYYNGTNTATLASGLSDGGSVYWITGSIGPGTAWQDGGGPRHYPGNAKLGPAPYNLNFTMLLSDFLPSGTNAVPITMKVYQGATLMHTQTQTMGSAGVYTSQIPIAITGAVRLTFDGHTFLRKGINVTLPPASSNGGVVTLQNGDADGTGEVDAADIDMAIAHFGQTPSSPGWNVLADLDRSNEVDAVDIDIVIANFGAVDDSI